MFTTSIPPRHNSLSLCLEINNSFLFPEDELSFFFTVTACTYVPDPVSCHLLVRQSFPSSFLSASSPSAVSIISCCNHSLSILLVPLTVGFCPHRYWHCYGRGYPVAGSNRYFSVLILMFWTLSLSAWQCSSPVIRACLWLLPFSLLYGLLLNPTFKHQVP